MYQLKFGKIEMIKEEKIEQTIQNYIKDHCIEINEIIDIKFRSMGFGFYNILIIYKDFMYII